LGEIKVFGGGAHLNSHREGTQDLARKRLVVVTINRVSLSVSETRAGEHPKV